MFIGTNYKFEAFKRIGNNDKHVNAQHSHPEVTTSVFPVGLHIGHMRLCVRLHYGAVFWALRVPSLANTELRLSRNALFF